MRAAYSAGKLNAALSYEWNKPRGGDNTNKSLTIGANYDFGVLKLMGGLQQNRNLATGSGNGAAVGVSNLTVTGATTLTLKDLNGYTIGAEIPVSAAATLGVNYTPVKYKGHQWHHADPGQGGAGRPLCAFEEHLPVHRHLDVHR